MPIVCTNDGKSSVLGVAKRVGLPTPPIEKKTLKEFRGFVRRWLRRNLTPLPLDTDYSLENWLSHTHYPQWRKDELRRAWVECGGVLKPRHYKCKSFVKVEWYEKFKYPRIINSRSDPFKCMTGPYFHAIEKAVFYDQATRKYFVKGVPVESRAKFIRERLEMDASVYACTDHTAFEAHMTPEILRACEFQLYSYMIAPGTPGRSEFLSHVTRALAGQNTCESKYYTFSISGTRMSGDMCTSLGNGFTNMMVAFYTAWKAGLLCDGIFEGDDGVMRFNATDRSKLPKEEDFAKIGMHVKLEYVDNLNVAKFCGLISHRDLDQNLSDPIEILCKFGWTTSSAKAGGEKVMKELLRAKGLSLWYELRHCPIAQALARYAIRVTEGMRPRFSVDKPGTMDWWDRQVMASYDPSEKYTPIDIDERNRKLVHDLFGVSPTRQKLIEHYLDEKIDLSPIPIELIGRDLIPDSWKHMYDCYKVYVPGGVSERIYR